MAIQEGVLPYSGKLGETIGYKRIRKGKKKHCSRKMPKQVRRSIATILSATDFGTASKAGKLLRRAWLKLLDIREDKEITNRLNKELLKMLYAGSDERGSRFFQREEIGHLIGFQFNETTGLSRLLPIIPKVVQDGKTLRIAIPAMTEKDIRHSSNTTHIEIKAIAMGVNFSEGTHQPAASDKVLIDFREPAKATELVLPFTAGADETMVVLQVTAYSEMNGKLYLVDNLKFFAADIIDIIPTLQEEAPQTVYGAQPVKASLFQLNGDRTYATTQRE